jgi:hypothetical protein
MRKLVPALALILFALTLQADAQSAAKNKTIGQLEKAFGEAFMAKSLGRLDAGRPLLGRVKIVTEHSIGETEFTSKSFKTLAEVERWIKSEEREDGTPFREVRPLIRCRKGLCTYDFDGGILHNHLYLQKIAYGYRQGRPYIKTIYFLDGG